MRQGEYGMSFTSRRKGSFRTNRSPSQAPSPLSSPFERLSLSFACQQSYVNRTGRPLFICIDSLGKDSPIFFFFISVRTFFFFMRKDSPIFFFYLSILFFMRKDFSIFFFISVYTFKEEGTLDFAFRISNPFFFL